jgi:hypothetical protein
LFLAVPQKVTLTKSFDAISIKTAGSIEGSGASSSLPISNTKTKEFLPSNLQEVHEWKRKGEARPRLVRWLVWVKKEY